MYLLILHLGGRRDVWSASHLGRFTQGGYTPIPTEQEGGWIPELVQTLRRTEKSFAVVCGTATYRFNSL